MPYKGLPRCECGYDNYWKPLVFRDGYGGNAAIDRLRKK